jgi:cytidine deaminase
MARPKIAKTENELLGASLAALKNAYLLWGFRVGAAVIAEDGEVYEGCNVESWVSGLGICAERCAINHAILHGNRKINELALVMDAAANREPRPCGACLQYISDFSASQHIKIIMAKAEEGKILTKTINVRKLAELFPFPYKK